MKWEYIQCHVANMLLIDTLNEYGKDEIELVSVFYDGHLFHYIFKREVK